MIESLIYLFIKIDLVLYYSEVSLVFTPTPLQPHTPSIHG